jgi:two-component system cell cycle response regulator CtrA
MHQKGDWVADGPTPMGGCMVHSPSVITAGKLTIDLDARAVEVDGNRVGLTCKEYQILELLSLRKGTALTKERFMDHLYGGVGAPEAKIVDVLVCKLRKKLAAPLSGEKYIQTVRGRGYVLRVSAIEQAA